MIRIEGKSLTGSSTKWPFFCPTDCRLPFAFQHCSLKSCICKFSACSCKTYIIFHPPVISTYRNQRKTQRATYLKFRLLGNKKFIFPVLQFTPLSTHRCSRHTEDKLLWTPPAFPKLSLSPLQHSKAQPSAHCNRLETFPNSHLSCASCLTNTILYFFCTYHLVWRHLRNGKGWPGSGAAEPLASSAEKHSGFPRKDCCTVVWSWNQRQMRLNSS